MKFVAYLKQCVKKPPTSSTPSLLAAPRVAPNVISTDGVFATGAGELAGVQATHTDVTMLTLMEGYTLYTGVFSNCHNAKSIYMRQEQMWPDILISMAKEANITTAQKDALYKYVLAIKVTQPVT